MDVRRLLGVPTVIPLLRGSTSSPSREIMLNMFGKSHGSNAT